MEFIECIRKAKMFTRKFSFDGISKDDKIFHTGNQGKTYKIF